jgi:hypothetical protein
MAAGRHSEEDQAVYPSGTRGVLALHLSELLRQIPFCQRTFRAPRKLDRHYLPKNAPSYARVREKSKIAAHSTGDSKYSKRTSTHELMVFDEHVSCMYMQLGRRRKPSFLEDQQSCNFARHFHLPLRNAYA